MFYARHFKPAVRRADVPDGLRFHDLRHTCAALLIANGAHPKEMQERLGHSTIRLTFDRYGHLFPSLDDRLRDGLDALFVDSLASDPCHDRVTAGTETDERPPKEPLTCTSMERTTGFEPATLTLAR